MTEVWWFNIWNVWFISGGFIHDNGSQFICRFFAEMNEKFKKKKSLQELSRYNETIQALWF